MNIYVVLFLLIVYYAIVPLLLSLIQNDAIQKRLYIIYLLGFVSVLICGVFGQVQFGHNIKVFFAWSTAPKQFVFNIIPDGLIDMVDNIVLLIPIGIVVYKFARKNKLLWAFIWGLGVGLFIELMQFLLPIMRYPSISDVLLNGISSFFGAAYMFIMFWLKEKIAEEIIREEQTIQENEQENIKENPKKSVKHRKKQS